MRVTYEELIEFVNTYEPSIDFRDKERTLLAEYLLTNVDDHGKIKKITNTVDSVEIEFSDSIEKVQVANHSSESFQRLIEQCKEYQFQNKLLQLDWETIIDIDNGDYDELDSGC